MDGQYLGVHTSVPTLPLWFYQIGRNAMLSVLSRKELEARLLARAFRDDFYLKRLAAEPKRLIEEEVGATLPETLEITVLEETDRTAYLVLPVNPSGNVGDTANDKNAELLLDDVRPTVLDREKTVAVIRRAWADGDFAQQLAADPMETLKSEMRLVLPANLDLRVVWETADRLFIVLPSLNRLPVYDWDIPEAEFDSVADSSHVLGTRNSKGAVCPTWKCPKVMVPGVVTFLD